MNNKFSIKKRINSFGYAIKGVVLFFRTQHNGWIHIASFIVALAAGFWFHLTAHEWIAILFASGFVFTAEIINTSIEFLTDIISPEYNEQAGKVKDLAAAAVLVASVTALVIGAVIFIPKLF